MQNILNFISQYAAIVALIGTYLIIMSHVRIHYYDKIRSKGRITEGVVTELIPKDYHSTQASVAMAPVVEFIPDVGVSRFRYVSSTYQYPSPYQVGQKVKIYYKGFSGSKNSIREVALEDDKPGNLPASLLRWGIVLCVISYPLIIWRLTNFLQ